jgi:chromate transporter
MTMQTAVQPHQPTSPTSPVTVAEMVRYFAWLGTVGFGGPVVLVERMRHDLQETRAWYSAAEYTEGLALAQLAPGPLAAQLAIYLGWVRRGLVGATVVGLAFIGPSFLMVLVLSAAYLRFGGLPWMRGAFYGIGAVVIALIGYSAWRLMRRTVGADRLLLGVVAVNAAVTAWTEREMVWLFIASGAVVWAARRTLAAGAPLTAAVFIPPWLLTGLHGEQTPRALVSILGYFTKAGAVVFGSGLAIVPFLHGGVVRQMHWLTERQFLDAVAVSMITPGPVVITVAFIGYQVAGPLGACAAAVGVFVPVYAVVVGVARWFHRVAQNKSLRAAVDGVTAAAIGAIVGAVIVLGRRALTDVATWVMFAAALGLILSVKKLPEPFLILAAGVAGIALHGTAA